jgi:hypothetical protein
MGVREGKVLAITEHLVHAALLSEDVIGHVSRAQPRSLDRVVVVDLNEIQ